ncbi:MAG: hypothetical protein PHT07_01965 [Paludibacter sp.]|nr:hypothetical protein [Paludibacter sp.]
MKKTLLFTVAVLLTAVSLSAQTVWNLGGDPTVATNGSAAWPLNTGLANGSSTTYGGTETVNGLTITTGMISTTSLCGVVSASVKGFTSPTTSITYAFVNKFLLNGAGYTGATNTDVTPLVNMPTQKYASFDVSGNSTIYMIGVTGSNGSARNAFVTNGTSLIGTVNFPSSNAALSEGIINYTGPATKLYLFFNASIALCYLSATNVVVTTSVNQVLSDKGISYNGNEILNTNGLSLEVYNVIGKKVAASMASIPTNKFQKGVYIVRAAGLNDSMKICL